MTRRDYTVRTVPAAVHDTGGDILGVPAEGLLADLMQARGLTPQTPALPPAGDDVERQARARFDNPHPTAAQALACAFLRPDPALTAALARYTLRPRQLAYECIMAEPPDDHGLGLTTAVLLAEAFVRVAASVVIAAGAFGGHLWWLVVLPLLWIFDGDAGPVRLAVPVVVVWLVTGWLAGGLALAAALLSAAHQLCGRRDAFLTTGIWLPMADWHAVQRWKNVRYARMRQALQARRNLLEETR